MQFKIPRKGYTENRQIYKHGTIEINQGITVLIGCNGSGKTTILSEIKETTKDIPTYFYNNLTTNDKESALFHEDYEYMAQLMCASEGESITLKLLHKADELIYLLKNGKKKLSALEEAFMSMSGRNNKEDKSTVKERILLFDAIDSGLSIDQVRDLKEYFFTPLLESYKDLYIIVSANEYEMCKDYPCFNVTEGKYVTINSYDDYTKEILKTREYKEKQIEKLMKVSKNDNN